MRPPSLPILRQQRSRLQAQLLRDYESLVWEDVAGGDIDDWLFFDGPRPGIMSEVTLPAARAAFDVVLTGQDGNPGYMNVEFRGGVAVRVVAGRTGDATIEFKDVSGD